MPNLYLPLHFALHLRRIKLSRVNWWFVARSTPNRRTELDKLYFFIAVSVIDPTVVPARKSNAQISFSQIERTLRSPSPLQSSRPFPDPTTPISDPLSVTRRLPPLHGKRPSGIFLARVILSTLFRSIATTSSSEKLPAPKMSARKTRAECRRRRY